MAVTVKRRQPVEPLPIRSIEIVDSMGDTFRLRSGMLPGERLVAHVEVRDQPETSGVLLEANDVEALRDALSDWLEAR